MSEQVENTQPTVTITADGNAVNLTLSRGTTAWEAIGLLETSLLLIKQQYNAAPIVTGAAEESALESGPAVIPE